MTNELWELRQKRLPNFGIKYYFPRVIGWVLLVDMVYDAVAQNGIVNEV